MSKLHRSDNSAPTDASPDRADARARFLALVQGALSGGTFARLVLAKPRAQGDDLARVTVRKLALRGAPGVSFLYSHATRDITKNLALAQGLATIGELIGAAFAHAHLFTTTDEVELRVGRQGRAGLSRRKVARATEALDGSPTHDRAKHRFVDIGRPWLADLGVTDAQGRLVPAMARKWKQINKFVEVFDHAYASSALKHRKSVRVVDFGSGKGYLTFAIHDHLRRALETDVQVTGVELRADLVELCNRAAERSALAGLRFVQGDVRTLAPEAIDVMIALHACDTATDHALHIGLRAGASILLCSPCCHKQLRPQMRAPQLLRPMLQHGIHLGQQAEMVTDSLRALLLEAEGYATQVFEFVALEHTSKNKMILAVKRDAALDTGTLGAIREQIRDIKAFYGIREHCLETLLAADAAVA
ncbi:MAG TPA: SAM-dependent methyltransferase [Caldimonas sp.]